MLHRISLIVTVLIVTVLVGLMFLATFASRVQADDQLATRLRELNTNVFSSDEARERELSSMLSRDARSRRQQANQRETLAWREVKTREDWERMRDERLRKLRESLGNFPEPPSPLPMWVSRTLTGEGYQVKNLVYESRPGLFVTANLYVPTEIPTSMPGIILCHSHHNPKTEGELQDMGQLWARSGCAVLVMDQLGHGERRTHPFRSAEDYAGSFRPSRQDYYFRFNTGMQLQTIGDSLVGWMVWDLSRGVDLLLKQPNIDPKRIVLLGSVAGGGDPCAVAGALDRRIATAVPFNFGGPQPESTFPLPADAEMSFNYAGGGSWESTRNLRLSSRDGFLPWVIVGGIAPRGLIYAHEFQWDRDRDPVWKRLETIFGLYGARDRLTSVYGAGSVSGQSGPANTHCNNIGAVHRQGGIYQAFQQWFDIAPPTKEVQERRPSAELLGWTPELSDDLAPKPLHLLADDIGTQRARSAREGLRLQSSSARQEKLRWDWTRLLGNIEPQAVPRVVKSDSERLL